MRDAPKAASLSRYVRGILVAGDFDPRAVTATRAVPNLSLKTYSFQFAFSEP